MWFILLYSVCVSAGDGERGGEGVCVWCVVSSAAGSVFVLGSSILKSLTLLLREPTTHWHRPCVCVVVVSAAKHFLITETWRHLSSRLRDGPGGAQGLMFEDCLSVTVNVVGRRCSSLSVKWICFCWNREREQLFWCQCVPGPGPNAAVTQSSSL